MGRKSKNGIMHILLIHQAFVSPEEAGGTRHFEFARFVHKSGHSMSIVASNLSYLSGRKIIEQNGFVSKQSIDGIRIFRTYTLASLHRNYLWRLLTFFSFMITSVFAALKAGPVDVFMGTSPPIFQALSAWLVATIRRKPFLLEIRDLWPEFAIDIGLLTNPILIQLSRKLEMFLYRHARHIIVNSPAYRDYLISKNISAKKISLIPNGVDPAMFQIKNEDALKFKIKLNLQDKFVVTYAGALGMANDIPTILRAAKRLEKYPQIIFLLVGDGKERSRLKNMLKEMNLQNVVFAGGFPKSEMPLILAASDVCVATLKDIPMFRTTYPNKVFDYMAAGRPVVLAIDGVIRQVVEKAGGGIFIPPGDDEALAGAVLYLNKHPEELKRMGQNARTYVIKNFNRESHARSFLSLIKNIAGS